MLYNFLLGLDKTLLSKANNKVVTLSPKNYHRLVLPLGVTSSIGQLFLFSSSRIKRMSSHLSIRLIRSWHRTPAESVRLKMDLMTWSLTWFKNNWKKKVNIGTLWVQLCNLPDMTSAPWWVDLKQKTINHFSFSEHGPMWAKNIGHSNYH